MTVTGVGSLPHDDAEEAASFTAATATVPYLPQLPNRHPEEGMLRQWGDGLCGCGAADGLLGLGYGAPTGPRHEAYGGAEAALARLGADTPVVKTQATGPVTMAAAMVAAGHPGEDLRACVTTALCERIEAHLDTIRRRLPGTEVLLVLDEPALAGVGKPGFPFGFAEAGDMLRSVLSGVAVRPGLHCCGGADWDWVASLRPALLSWDIATLDTGAPVGPGLEGAVAAGMRIMWGVVPTDVLPVPAPGTIAERVSRLIGLLAGQDGVWAEMADRSLFSPACGLAGVTVDQAHAIMESVHTVAGEFRHHG